MYINILESEKKCPICGKLFMARPEYVYKRVTKNRVNYMCSWKCLNMYDDEHDRRKGRKPNQNVIDEIKRLAKEGRTAGQISDELGVNVRRVRYQLELTRCADPDLELDAV